MQDLVTWVICNSSDTSLQVFINQNESIRHQLPSIGLAFSSQD